MPALPSVENTVGKTEALKRRLGFRQFIAQYPCRLFSKDQIILLQDETPEGVFVIESGKVRTYTITPNGYEQLISIHSRGENIPIGFSFGLAERSQYFYEAYTKCITRIIPRETFLKHLRSDIDLMHQAHLYNIEQLSSTLRRIHALGQPRASKKVALTLIYLAERLGVRSWAKPRFHELSVTQEEIANLLGMTRETVGCELKKLRINNMISYSRKRYVLYSERIEEYLKNRR